MKVALYVCRVGKGWSMMLSIDIRVDVFGGSRVEVDDMCCAGCC